MASRAARNIRRKRFAQCLHEHCANTIGNLASEQSLPAVRYRT
ncbi:hypothetical protein XCR_1033 [Xanthomonas campestris pv. raphani 756C]|nr:hypothetical protein XCR_1033 [Xanthomonas campestris pv. raphani 756C]